MDSHRYNGVSFELYSLTSGHQDHFLTFIILWSYLGNFNISELSFYFFVKRSTTSCLTSCVKGDLFVILRKDLIFYYLVTTYKYKSSSLSLGDTLPCATI